mmetsp:Transcript_7196/g.14788  ORF Transcript_7196/g.14788 Transcript_7196/m.14788 type:complete len:259 (-) Transcript_7196:2196-2972(-)
MSSNPTEISSGKTTSVNTVISKRDSPCNCMGGTPLSSNRSWYASRIFRVFFRSPPSIPSANMSRIHFVPSHKTPRLTPAANNSAITNSIPERPVTTRNSSVCATGPALTPVPDDDNDDAPADVDADPEPGPDPPPPLPPTPPDPSPPPLPPPRSQRIITPQPQFPFRPRCTFSHLERPFKTSRRIRPTETVPTVPPIPNAVPKDTLKGGSQSHRGYATTVTCSKYSQGSGEKVEEQNKETVFGPRLAENRLGLIPRTV